MNAAQIITANYIKTYYNGYIDGNVDDDYINTSIRISQDTRIQSVLGSKLYNKILNDIITTGAPVGAKYIILCEDYIQKSLALWSLYEIAINLDVKLTNKGVVHQNSDFSNTADESRFQRKLNNIMNNAKFYDQRITEYLINNTDISEQFTIDGLGKVNAKRNSYLNGGLYLGNDKYYDC